MRRSTVAALVGAMGLVVPGAAAVGTGVPAREAPVQKAPVKKVPVTQAAVLTTPGSVTLSTDKKDVTVRVQYQCTNSKLYRHYVTGHVQQGTGDDAVTYSIGYRNENGIREARCTGRLVTESLKMPRTWWTETQGKALASGPAEMLFAVSRHNAPGHGPGWYTTHSTASVARTVAVRTP